MKKGFYVFCTLMVCFLLVGCGESSKKEEQPKNENIEGKLTDIMDKLYEGISEDEMPMMVESMELTSENFEYFAFADIKYKEAIASESMTGSIAHSVVLIRLENAEDAEAAVKEIEKNANPRKWICVEAENTYVLSKGDLVILIMSNDLALKIKENFENLK